MKELLSPPGFFTVKNGNMEIFLPFEKKFLLFEKSLFTNFSLCFTIADSISNATKSELFMSIQCIILYQLVGYNKEYLLEK